jgi:hypothetical protein
MCSLISLCKDEVQHISTFIEDATDLVHLSRTCISLRRFLCHTAVFNQLLLQNVRPLTSSVSILYDFSSLIFDVCELRTLENDYSKQLNWLNSFSSNHKMVVEKQLNKLYDEHHVVKDQLQDVTQDLVCSMLENKLCWREGSTLSDISLTYPNEKRRASRDMFFDFKPGYFYYYCIPRRFMQFRKPRFPIWIAWDSVRRDYVVEQVMKLQQPSTQLATPKQRFIGRSNHAGYCMSKRPMVKGNRYNFH